MLHPRLSKRECPESKIEALAISAYSFTNLQVAAPKNHPTVFPSVTYQHSEKYFLFHQHHLFC